MEGWIIYCYSQEKNVENKKEVVHTQVQEMDKGGGVSF